MKTIKYYLLFFLTIISFNKLYSQKEIKDLPNDLNKETIIFLEYETLEIDKKMPWTQRHMYKVRNELSVGANAQLNEYSKDYPFNYVISKRSEYKDSLIKTCRYLLENDLMESYNNGVNNYAGRGVQYTSPMYVRDLKTGDKYILFDVPSNHCYIYKGIIKDFIKIVKKKYNLKKK